MKIRRPILWLSAVVAVLLVSIVWLAKRPAETLVVSRPAADVTVETAQHKSAAMPDWSESIPATPPVNAASPAPTFSTAASTSKQSKEGRTREVLSTLNDVPVVFYGKLKDQFSNPVEGAEITGSIIYDNGSSNGVREIKTVSDTEGFFQFQGGTGESLSVVPRKDGYTLASANAGFKYSYFYPEARHVPNPSQPVVIEMWKFQGAERLIHFQTKAYVRLDGTPSAFDLQTGKPVESGGDIIISIESSATPDPIQRYAWKVRLQAVRGGVIPWKDAGFEKMFLAPEFGYEPEIIIAYQSDVKPWSSRFTGGFYFMSRDGAIYGKLGLAIITDVVKNESIPVTVSGYLNPSGSRNLEVNPALVTEAKP